MDSPGREAQPLKSSQTQPWSWIPSTSYTWLVTPWMSAADAFSKNSTTGAGGPQTPCTRPAGCLHTRSCLLTPRQQHQLLDLFAIEEHVALEVTWSTYQNITWCLPCTRHERGQGHDGSRNQYTDLHAHTEGPDRAHDAGQDTQTPSQGILAYFEHPHTTGGPTEAINAPLEHLRGSVLGFRNLTNYIARCLLETGGFRPQLHPQL